ncbi:hypothetical protein [Nonomuraea sp. SYSU D8015]|uniref:hypothetical protein n=1 Tax=Nonomuraea sp. SYSU D8015 TaxID=2593644 RepID=UPI001CB71A67|nr:hypothetical protein [Nonomuraea sp. SYSU D8015]
MSHGRVDAPLPLLRAGRHGPYAPAGWRPTWGGPGGRPVAEGARSLLWAADVPGDGPAGGFFRDSRPISW